ncbi:MAG: ABC transporter permease, partial [Chloroflexota bacterium]|nr:ABC transporter permease [Chloroflexota bacterium]
MLTLLIRRLLGALLVLLGISVITFLLARVVPGDPARLMAGPKANQEAVQALRVRLGLTGPLPQQYIRYMGGLLQGDMGLSFSTKRPVAQDIRSFFPATAELALFALLIGVVIGIPGGILSAVWKNSFFDIAGRLLSTLGVALPSFWVGLLLQWWFYGVLDWLPVGSRLGEGVQPPPHVTGFYTLDALVSGQLALLPDIFAHLL